MRGRRSLTIPDTLGPCSRVLRSSTASIWVSTALICDCSTGISFAIRTGSGIFNFSNQWVNGPRADTPAANTGFPLAALLLGAPASASIDQNTAVAILNKYYGFFVQDDWRLTPRLTLNLGLRYEYETPRTERYDRTTRGFDRAASYNLGGIASRGGLAYANTNGLPRGISNQDTNNFAPRIGIAWSLTPKTVLRSGYALNYVQE